MVCGSCGPKTLTVEDMKYMTSEQIIAAYRQGYKLVQGGAQAPAPQVMSQDQNWQYGGTVYNRSMQDLSVPGIGPTVTCPTGKGSGSTVTFTANPTGGIGPYTVRFWYAPMGSTATLTAVAAQHVGIAEGTPSSDNHVLTDADINAALGNAAAPAPVDVNLTTFAPVLTGAATALAAGSIRLYSCAVDSCTGAGYPGTCVQWCDLAITCAAPTCNFVVT